MTTRLNLGHLHLIGEAQGEHIVVRVLGHGEPGHRPLLGTLTMAGIEWSSLCAFEELHQLADQQRLNDLTEIHRRDYQLAKANNDLRELLETYKASLGSANTVAGNLEKQVDAMKRGLHAYAPIRSILGDWDWAAVAREADKLSPLRFAAEALAKVADAHAELVAEAAKEPKAS